jgi:hypothetical protein
MVGDENHVGSHKTPHLPLLLTRPKVSIVDFIRTATSIIQLVVARTDIELDFQVHEAFHHYHWRLASERSVIRKLSNLFLLM